MGGLFRTSCQNDTEVCLTMVRVAIIGTAGRKNDAHKMNKKVFDEMVFVAQEIILSKFGLKLSDVELVSGGSAWADHVAVRLWLKSLSAASDSDTYAGLKLYLPSNYHATEGRILFEGSAGQALNQLHGAFSQKMNNGFDSRADLLCAEALGADLDCSYPGFLNRNLQVAKADYIIAFTWSNSPNSLKEGGTKHTWDHSLHATKVHVPLNSLQGENPMTQAFSIQSSCAVGNKRKFEIE